MAKIPKATAADPEILNWKPSWAILAGIALAGFILILYVHSFRRTPSVLFLTMGWVSILAAGGFLWQAGLLIAAGDTGDDGSFRSTRTRGDDLQAEKGSLLKAIKEVEFDHAMGKMSEFDAKQITSVYRVRALAILKELDDRAGGRRADDPERDEVLTIAERIERDIRARTTLAAAHSRGRSKAQNQSKAQPKPKVNIAEASGALASFQKKLAATAGSDGAEAGASRRDEEE